MNMDFKSAKELLDLCEENQLPISEVMRQRECILGEVPRDAVDHRMAKAWEIMHASATQPLKKPIKSMGGLIGGEAKKLETHYNKKKNICGDVLQKAMTYAMAVLEVNASMGLIVAAPTAGSAGVVPGMMLALQECYRISDQRIVDALFNAGAVGYLAMRNATVAGAVGGCQAEVGAASAMAAICQTASQKSTAETAPTASPTHGKKHNAYFMFSFSQSAGGIGIFEYMANATLKLFHIVFILFFFYSDGNPIHNLGHTVRHLCQTYINVSQDPLVFHRLLLISVSIRKNFIRHQNQIPRLMGQTGNARKNFLLRPRFSRPGWIKYFICREIRHTFEQHIASRFQLHFF